jgi:hypothetical protein
MTDSDLALTDIQKVQEEVEPKAPATYERPLLVPLGNVRNLLWGAGGSVQDSDSQGLFPTEPGQG